MFDKGGADMGVLHCGELGQPPSAGAHARAVHNSVRFLRGVQPEPQDHILPMAYDTVEVPVHVGLASPSCGTPVAAQVALNMDERREVGFKGHRGRRPPIKVSPFAVWGGDGSPVVERAIVPRSGRPDEGPHWHQGPAVPEAGS